MLQGTCQASSENILFYILRMVFEIEERILPHSMLYICPQTGVKFLADSNRWNVNATPNLRNGRRMLGTEPAASDILTMFLHRP